MPTTPRRYFIAKDGDNEDSLWVETDRQPRMICRRFDTLVEVWDNVVEHMAGRIS
jgi:hypothetical protein